MNPALARNAATRWLRLGAAGIALSLASACGSLLPKAPPPTAFYALDRTARPVSPAGAVATDAKAAAARPTLIVNPPHAGAGFDSARIVYQREPHRLEYFARSEWVDTPARQLEPLIVTVLEREGVFAAVLQTPSAASGDLRLDTEIVRLQQVFGASAPSRVQLTLRATLVDTATHRVLAQRQFEADAAAPSDDAQGGVAAAHVAVQAVLDNLATFCSQAAQTWTPAGAASPGRAGFRPAAR